MKRIHHREGGATLLISLIMLIMLTLFAISAMNTGTINLKMVGNMQVRSEAMDASQSTIESVLSTVQFINTPNDAIPLGLACGAPNTTCTDVNNDGSPEYTTRLTPTPACVQARPIKISELNLTPTSEDLACVQAQQQGTFGVAGAATSGDSLCGNSIWELTAQTLDTGTTAATSTVNVTITQGIGVRIKALDLATSCL
jgi:Tfp pilus assembly protein PilX